MNKVVLEDATTNRIQQELNHSLEQKKQKSIQPFNPNYLSDYKAYQLGLSVEAIDRLLKYRKQGKYVNSVKEFQQVTVISDTLLQKIAPYFKFPNWVRKKQTVNVVSLPIVVKDVNSATFQDFLKIKGIGLKRAKRIVKYRELLGGYSYQTQLDEVWGIPKDILQQVKKKFKVLTQPVIQKIDVNKATVNELNKIVYINYKQAKSIISYREEVAEIQNLAELKGISNFPVDKFDLITLYLLVY